MRYLCLIYLDGKMLEAMPEIRSLAGGLFEQDPRAAGGTPGEDRGEAVGDELQAAALGA